MKKVGGGFNNPPPRIRDSIYFPDLAHGRGLAGLLSFARPAYRLSCPRTCCRSPVFREQLTDPAILHPESPRRRIVLFGLPLVGIVRIQFLMAEKRMQWGHRPTEYVGSVPQGGTRTFVCSLGAQSKCLRRV
jgi:hypothetical protein